MFVLGMPLKPFLIIIGTQLIWVAVILFVVIRHWREDKQKQH
jgi:hypothetical protein